MSDFYSTQATPVTPDSLAIRRKLAAALMGQASDTSPVRAWSQGAARIAQGLLGGYDMGSADREQNAARESAIADFTKALAPGAQAGPSQSAPPSPMADASQPRGYRNNNPLNIEAGSFTQGQPGYAGSDGRFAKFASLDQGTSAANKLLDTYQNKYGLNTPEGIVGRWAPSSDGNNTQAYAASIAKALGISPTDPVPPEMRQKLIAAMAQHENGAPMPAPQQPQQPAQGGINPQLIRALSNQFLPPAMGQIAAGQINSQLAPPEFKQTGQSVLGQPQYSWVDPRKQTITPINGGGVGGPSGDVGADPSFQKIQQAVQAGAPPEQVYQHIPLELREAVKSIVDGRGVPQSIGNRGAARTAAMMYAHAVDPSFDEALLPQRMTFARSMGSTAPTSVGGQKLLLGTALGHLAELSDSASGLDNVNGMGLAPLGHATNMVRGLGTEQSAKIVALEDKAQKFAGEVGKLYSGSNGGGVHEREDTRKRFSGSMTSAELASSLEASRDLIKSKIDALENQRDQVYGPQGRTRIEFVDKTAKENLAKIEATIAKLRGQNSQQPQGNVPTGVDPKAWQYMTPQERALWK